MKTIHYLVAAMLTVVIFGAGTVLWAESRAYKMTTATPHQITTADKVETPNNTALYTLGFFELTRDGPTEPWIEDTQKTERRSAPQVDATE